MELLIKALLALGTTRKELASAIGQSKRKAA